jgi:hypothetical protein
LLLEQQALLLHPVDVDVEHRDVGLDGYPWIRHRRRCRNCRRLGGVRLKPRLRRRPAGRSSTGS